MLQTKTHTAQQSCWLPDIQIFVEGNIALPDDAPAMGTLLEVSACAAITRAQPGNDILTLEGRAQFKILYTDTAGGLYGFDAETDFAHTAACPGALPAMEAVAWAHTEDIRFRAADPRSLEVACLLQAAAFAACEAPLPLLDPAGADPAVQLRTQDFTACRTECLTTFRLPLEAELRVPQSLPAVKRVLHERGYAMLRETVCEEGRAAIEGELKLFLVYESTDKNAPLQHLEETVSFGEVLAQDGLRQDSRLCGICTLEALSTHADEEDTDLVHVEAEVGVCLLACREQPVTVVSDLYAPGQCAQLTHTPLCTRSIHCGTPAKKVLRLSAELPADAPEVSRVLFGAAYPRIAEATLQGDQLVLAGVVTLDLCYTAAASSGRTGLCTTRMTLPFETGIAYTPVAAGCAFAVQAAGEYAIAEGSGRELEVKCCLDLCILEVHTCHTEGIREAIFTEPDTPAQPGFVVYYAEGGETLWEVAKRFGVRQQAVFGAEGETPLTKGQRLVLVEH